MSASFSQDQKNRFVLFWVASIAIIFLFIGGYSVSAIITEKHAANLYHKLRMTPGAIVPGRTPPDPLPETGDFVPVQIGVYLDGVENFSIKDSFWTPTFYVWFSWKGSSSLDPGKNFQLVDAKIEKKELVESYNGADGTNYQRYRVTAKVAKFFNTSRVPLDDHLLNVYIEDAARDASKLRYVADPATNVSSRVVIPGYKLTGFTSVVKPHTYRSTYGDPRVAADSDHTTFTEFTLGIDVKRSSMAVYFKLFVGLFAGVLLTIGSFFIRPSDTSHRFGLPSAAYFGAVANSYIVNSSLPPTEHTGLADMVTAIGMFTIFICFVCSLTSAYFFLKRDEKELSARLDSVSWKAIAIGFVGVNIALPVAAVSAL
jgi:hypothetical protein